MLPSSIFFKNNINIISLDSCSFITIDSNLDSSDPSPTKIEFIIGIECELYDINALAMQINICKRVDGDDDAIEQNAMGIDVDGIPNGMTSMIDILKILLLILLVDVLTIILDVIDLNLDKLSKFECGEGNHNIIIVVNMYKSNIPVRIVIIGFFYL